MPKFYDPDYPVPIREQSQAAWHVVLLEIRQFMIGVLLVILSGVFSYHATRFVIARGYDSWAVPIIIGVLVTIAIGWTLHLRKETIRKEMFGRPDPWFKNSGHPPADFDRVSVEYVDGKKRWNVPTNDLIWNLDANNPIKTYYPKYSNIATLNVE